MPDNDFEKLEQALVRAGQAVIYPPTPALALRVRAALDQAPASRRQWLPRRTFVTLAALVIAAGLLLAFPEAREALAQFLGLRTIRILPVTPTPTLTAPATSVPGAQGVPGPTPTVPTAPSPTRGGARVQCCSTTLGDVQARARFKILLPPSESPTRVYLQELPNFGDAQQMILVFGDPNSPRFSLYEATGFLYGKLVSGGTVIEEAQVRGQRALWLSGAPHALVYLDANGQSQFQSEQTVNANTLAWEMGAVTYRLETNVSKDEAIRFAESLQ